MSMSSNSISTCININININIEVHKREYRKEKQGVTGTVTQLTSKFIMMNDTGEGTIRHHVCSPLCYYYSLHTPHHTHIHTHIYIHIHTHLSLQKDEAGETTTLLRTWLCFSARRTGPDPRTSSLALVSVCIGDTDTDTAGSTRKRSTHLPNKPVSQP